MARIAFVQQIYMEYPGITQLSAVLKERGNEVAVFIGGSTPCQVEDVARFAPHILGFPCTTGLEKSALQAAGVLKKRCGALSVFGGPHPTFFPEIIEEPEVDCVCVGEGEGALTDLAEAVDLKREIGGIPNLWVKKDGFITKNETRPLIEELDNLPFPDRSVYYGRYPHLNRSQKMFMAGRGCPYKCTYCFNDSLHELYRGKGSFVRLRSPERVVSEIAGIKKNYGLKTAYLSDDTFIINKPWLFDFLPRYKKEVGVPFICLVRADLVTEEIVKSLKEAGCYAAFFGVESGSESLRKAILGKDISDSQIRECARLFKEYKVGFRTYNMFAIPGESLEQAFSTVDLNIAIKADYPWASILQPYPKTAIRKVAQEKGLLEEEGFSAYFFKGSVLRNSQKKEICNLQKLFFWTVKFPFLKPIVRMLIRLPSNIIFDLFFLLGYAYSYLRSERMSVAEVLRLAGKNLRSFILPGRA